MLGSAGTDVPSCFGGFVSVLRICLCAQRSETNNTNTVALWVFLIDLLWTPEAVSLSPHASLGLKSRAFIYTHYFVTQRVIIFSNRPRVVFTRRGTIALTEPLRPSRSSLACSFSSRILFLFSFLHFDHKLCGLWAERRYTPAYNFIVRSLSKTNFIILLFIGLFLKYFFEYCTVLYITLLDSLI